MELIFSLCKFSSAVIAVMLREENMLIEDVYHVQIVKIKSYLDINTSVGFVCQ